MLQTFVKILSYLGKWKIGSAQILLRKSEQRIMENIKLNNESLYERFDSAAVQDKKLSDTLGKVRSTFSDKLEYQKKEIESKIDGKIEESDKKMDKKFEEIETNMNYKFEDMKKPRVLVCNWPTIISGFTIEAQRTKETNRRKLPG